MGWEGERWKREGGKERKEKGKRSVPTNKNLRLHP